MATYIDFYASSNARIPEYGEIMDNIEKYGCEDDNMKVV